jgi:hypothetical protein
LHPCGNIGRLTERQLLRAASCADITDHYEPGVNANADLNRAKEPSVEVLQLLYDSQPCPDGSCGIILMGGWVAEVD